MIGLGLSRSRCRRSSWQRRSSSRINRRKETIMPIMCLFTLKKALSLSIATSIAVPTSQGYNNSTKRTVFPSELQSSTKTSKRSTSTTMCRIQRNRCCLTVCAAIRTLRLIVPQTSTCYNPSKVSRISQFSRFLRVWRKQ